MKKLFYLGFLGLLLIGCQEDEEAELPGNNSGTSDFTVGKVDLCHFDAEYNTWDIISVSENALEAHLNHGDVQLVDNDGDGWVEALNECVPGGDCDDNDASVNPGAEEVCGDGIDNDCDGQLDEDCGCSDCPTANAELYAPYIDVTFYNYHGYPAAILIRPNGGRVQITYDLNLPGKYEFLVFPEYYNEVGGCNRQLNCGEEGSCEYFFSLPIEEMICVIQEAQAMYRQLLPENQNKNDFQPIRISDLKQ